MTKPTEQVASNSARPLKRGVWLRPMSLRHKVYNSTAPKTNGSNCRKKSGEISVTHHAPKKEPAIAKQAAGNMTDQLMATRLLYCQVAKVVPQTEALLLVPNKVAGVAVG